MDRVLSQSESGPGEGAASLRREDFALQEVLQVILVRWRVIAGVISACAAVSLLVGFLWPANYEARALIVIETRDRQVGEYKSVVAALPRDLYVVDTEVQIISSDATAKQVVRRLSLHNDPDFHVAGEEPPAALGREALEAFQIETAARALMESVRFTRPGLSYSIEVMATSKTAEKAAKIANAYGEVYLQQQRDNKLSAVTAANDVLLTRLADLRAQVREKEEAIERFRTSTGLIGAAGVNLSEAQTAELNRDLVRYRTELAAVEARLDVVRKEVAQGGSGEALAEALRSDVIRDLRNQQLAFDRRSADLATQYGPRHPVMLSLEAERADLDKRLREELRRILANMETEVAIARERYQAVNGLLGQERRSLASQNLDWVRMRELQREADATQAVYESFLASYQQIAQGIDVEVPDARIAAPATPPLEPTKPSKALLLAVGLVMGALLATFLVYALELLQRCLRSPGDVERRLGLPCVGVFPTLTDADAAPSARLLDVNGPEAAFGEAVLAATAALTAGRSRAQARVMVLAGAHAGEGSSWAALSIARMAARLGMKVVVIDGDQRGRGLSKLAGVTPRTGLLEAALGRAGLSQAMMADPEGSARIAALSGELGAGLPRGYGMDRLGPIFTALRKHFDLVVIDSPPALDSADARFFVEFADGVVIVCRWGETPSRVVLDAVDVLRRAGGRVVGALVQKGPTTAPGPIRPPRFGQLLPLPRGTAAIEHAS